MKFDKYNMKFCQLYAHHFCSETTVYACTLALSNEAIHVNISKEYNPVLTISSICTLV